MIQYIPVPQGFAERFDARSGIMMSKKPGIDDQYGVIVTMSDTISPNDFDISQLVGLHLENTIMGNNPTRFFEILGGYFIDNLDQVNPVVTTQVFGIALDRAKGFDIAEGGTTILYDHWHYINLDDEFLNERDLPLGRGGWTFIVVPRYEGQFPVSLTPLKIAQICPEITGIAHSEGTLKSETQELSFIAEFALDFGESESVEWNFGDGSPLVTTTENHQLSHVFDRQTGSDVLLTVSARAIGPSICESSASISVSIPQKPVICPEILTVAAITGATTDDTQVINFSIEFAAGKGVPEKVSWNFGDGNTAITTGSAHEVTHTFARPAEGDVNYTVSAHATGPGACESEGSVGVSIPEKPVICPELVSIIVTSSAPEENTQTITFEAKFGSDGRISDTVTWDFGDGSPTQTTTGPHQVAHSYNRLESTTKVYTVHAVGAGPEACAASASTEVSIPIKPRPCPTLGEISHSLQLTAIEAELIVSVKVEGDQPDKFVWKWGDGTPDTVTTDPAASHTYIRPKGAAQTYPVSVLATGPGDCETSAQFSAEVPARCPRIIELKSVLAAADGKNQAATVSTVMDPEMGDPVAYIWHWGDGSAPETTADSEASHTYLRQTGTDTSYEVRVIGQGPDGCETDGQTTIVIGAIPCPQLTGLTAKITDTQATRVSVTATATATVSGGTPEKYRWDWGDGTTSETTVPTASHDYDRRDAAQTYAIGVAASGPGSCKSNATANVTIPALEKQVVPLLCRLMQWIVAYLVSVTSGVLLVFSVDAACDSTPNGGLTTLTVIMVILTIAAIAIWYRYRKALCPPKICDWYAVAWTALFTTTATAFYAMSCCGSNGWIAGLIFFVLGALFAYLWFTRCAVTSRVQTFLLHVAIFVVASLICLFAVADSFLSCL